MMRGARPALAAALAVSLGLHVAGVMLTLPRTEMAEPAAAPATARLGTAFRDVAQGVQRPVTPGAAASMTPPAPAQKVPVADAAPAPRPDAARPVLSASALRPEPPEAAPTAVPAPARVPAAQTPLRPDPARIAPASPPDRLSALPDAADVPAPNLSSRPLQRPARIEAAAKARADAARQRQQAQSRGAQRAQTRGSADGQRSAAATSTVASASAAELSRFTAQMRRCIQTARRARMSQTGSARVGFDLAASGALTSVRILRSSGNAQFDRAALRAVRSVRSCPAPPPGAQRRFVVTIGT